ncbi:MAG: hypothetical protein KTR16_17250 [Acidiferrobacterales bacterium]|nr:hypothetical protein [Acidiferrobacterales bacterium]
MKIRYANRFISGQRRLLLWSYGFWFMACFLMLSLVVEAKQEECESMISIATQEVVLSEARVSACDEISLEPFLRLIPVG